MQIRTRRVSLLTINFMAFEIKFTVVCAKRLGSAGRTALGSTSHLQMKKASLPFKSLRWPNVCTLFPISTVICTPLARQSA